MKTADWPSKRRPRRRLRPPNRRRCRWDRRRRPPCWPTSATSSASRSSCTSTTLCVQCSSLTCKPHGAARGYSSSHSTLHGPPRGPPPTPRPLPSERPGASQKIGFPWGSSGPRMTYTNLNVGFWTLFIVVGHLLSLRTRMTSVLGIGRRNHF